MMDKIEQTRKRLIEVAKARQTIPFDALQTQIGVDEAGLVNILTQITHDDAEANRPLLTVLVVGGPWMSPGMGKSKG